MILLIHLMSLEHLKYPQYIHRKEKILPRQGKVFQKLFPSQFVKAKL